MKSPTRSLCLLIAAASLLLARPSAAVRNNPFITLEFLPQQGVVTETPSVTPAMRSRPVALEVLDDRGLEDALWLGTRTDDSDRVHQLTATSAILEFADGTLRKLGSDWGLSFDEGAALGLRLTLTRFDVRESNQAVGATFEADVRLAAELKDAAGRRLWAASQLGDATRYGRKFSNTNCNEVLSDALLEAFSELLSDPGLHRAWAGESPMAPSEPAATVPSAAPLAPSELRAELVDLMAQGMEPATLVVFLRGKSLSAPIDAEELSRWKEAGIPEEVMRTALVLPVH